MGTTRRPRLALAVAAVALLALLAPRPADAWMADGHAMVAAEAVAALPAEVPEFFRQGGSTVSHLAVDPDVMKLRGLPQLRAVEYPEHYLDLERLRGEALPLDRYEYLALLDRLDVRPADAGLLVYAIIEGVQRLTLAFAEHRRLPEDPAIHAKTLVYAGHLAHYAADLVQPLHTSVHHDGRALPSGESPHTGIHHAVDGLFTDVSFDRQKAIADLAVAPLENPMLAVLAELHGSHALVDRVYALEPRLHGEGADLADPRVVAFTVDRYRAAVTFLATLYTTAWERSGTLELPFWWSRPGWKPPPPAPATE